MKRFAALALVCVFACQAFFVLNVSAATDRYVSNYSELTQAIALASAGDKIIITNNILSTQQISISKSLTIDGMGHSISVPTPGLSDAGTYNTNPSTFRVFDISGSGNTVSISNCTIKGGRVAGGYSDGGGAIRNVSSVLKLNNVTISNSQAGNSLSYNTGCGGGVFNSAGTVYFKDCNVSRNAASYGGGFVNIGGGKMFIENSTFSENRSLCASGGGGAGENKASLYINNSTFSNNKSTELGGAINNNGTAQAYIVNSTFVGNVSYSSYKGGAIANNGFTATVTAVNSLFAYNYYLSGSTYVLSDVEAYSTSSMINAYYCIFQNLDTTDINPTACKIYNGNASGSNNTLVTGGILTKVLGADGTEVGSSMVFQPLLCKRYGGSRTLTALLKNGSLSYGNGTRAGFTNGNGTPTIGYYNGSSWVTLLGSNPSEYEILFDQNYDGQLTPRSVGAVITYASNLYMLKVNAAAGGSFLGGSIYGDVYPSGTPVSLTAIADNGKRFVRWDYVLGGTGTASTNNPYTVTVDRNITLVPVFEDVTGFTVSYYGNGNSEGTTPLAQEFPLNGSVTIADAPSLVKDGYVFAGWDTRSDGLGTDYAPGALYNSNENLILYAEWEKLPIAFNVTYNANDSTGGTAPADSSYDEGATVTVADNTGKLKKTGYAFAGWNTKADGSGTSYIAGTGTFVMGSADVTLYAQFVETEVTVKKLDDDFEVIIDGWEAEYQYQVWSYQKVIGDFVLDVNANVPANQWILAHAYTAGSEGILNPDGSLSFIIDDFVSPDNNYTIAVRIADENMNFLAEVRDSYTKEDVEEVVITKVLVDGKYSKGFEVKKIEAGSSVALKVVTNNVAGTTVTARVLSEPEALTATGAKEFTWNTSGFAPAKYTVEFTATNGTTADTQEITVQLYSSDPSIQYATISAMELTQDEYIGVPKTIGINPTFSNGSVYYKISEAGRKAMLTTGLYDTAGDMEYTFTKYGTYQVSCYVNREYEVRIGDFYDDGIIKTFTVKRDGAGSGTSSATLTAYEGEAVVNLANPVTKGTQLTFVSGSDIAGIGTTNVQYSFWRYDAKGYALVKDWSSENFLNWMPARVGEYTIEVRSKGADAGSYEAKRSVLVTVTDATDQMARGVSILMNEEELNLNARAREPITIQASATSTNTHKLLYKFIIADEFLGARTVQNYSINQDYVWTPRKPGTYKVSVLVKSDASFGRYDAIKTYEISVS